MKFPYCFVVVVVVVVIVVFIISKLCLKPVGECILVCRFTYKTGMNQFIFANDVDDLITRASE